MLYEVKVFREVTTYEKEWYKVEADSKEEAAKIIKNGTADFQDGKCIEIQDGEYVDEDKWEYKILKE